MERREYQTSPHTRPGFGARDQRIYGRVPVYESRERQQRGGAPLGLVIVLFLLVAALCGVCALTFRSQREQGQRVRRLEASLTWMQGELSAMSGELEELRTRLAETGTQGTVASPRADYDAVVKAVAHRGLSDFAPENTLPAYVLAWENGFSYVETDIFFTLDGKPVCLHDGSIDRTSSGSGMATDMTLDALRQYDFGAWKGPEFAGTKIPTFEEFLTLCRNLGLHPYIELKAHDNATEERIASLVETVRAYGMEDKVTWISFSYQLLAVVHNCSPNARLGYLVTEVNYQNVSEARWLQNGTNEVFMNSASYSDAECRLCAENGLPLEVWTLDTEEEILALNPYISGVTSDCLHAGKVLETAYLSR